MRHSSGLALGRVDTVDGRWGGGRRRRLAAAAMMHTQIGERDHEIKPQTCTELLLWLAVDGDAWALE